MTGQPDGGAAILLTASSTARKALGGGRTCAWAVSAGLLAALACLSGGCATSGKAVVLEDAAAFQSVALGAKQPALVMFFKQGCAACAALEPGMDQLAQEYHGRALVSKIMVLNLVFISPIPELKERYEIGLVPTVLLFVDGQERQRWVADYNLDNYRKALDALVAPA